MQEDGRTLLVLTDRHDLFREYMEKQYGVRVEPGHRSVFHNGNCYVHGYQARDAKGLDRNTTVIVIHGGRSTPAYAACVERFEDIRYRETLP